MDYEDPFAPIIAARNFARKHEEDVAKFERDRSNYTFKEIPKHESDRRVWNKFKDAKPVPRSREGELKATDLIVGAHYRLKSGHRALTVKGTKAPKAYAKRGVTAECRYVHNGTTKHVYIEDLVRHEDCPLLVKEKEKKMAIERLFEIDGIKNSFCKRIATDRTGRAVVEFVGKPPEGWPSVAAVEAKALNRVLPPAVAVRFVSGGGRRKHGIASDIYDYLTPPNMEKPFNVGDLVIRPDGSIVMVVTPSTTSEKATKYIEGNVLASTPIPLILDDSEETAEVYDDDADDDVI